MGCPSAELIFKGPFRSSSIAGLCVVVSELMADVTFCLSRPPCNGILDRFHPIDSIP